MRRSTPRRIGRPTRTGSRLRRSPPRRSLPGLTRRNWKNWAGDQRCAPERIERPASEDELARLVADARRVKVAGAGHSFTDIACTDGLLVDLSRMNRVLSVEGNEVTVEAGITIRELAPALAERGLALESQGDVDAQTIAGAISTATHGTGGRFANISSQVTGVRLITASGERIDMREHDDLLAARVSLGALGAISAVTLRCVPAFTIHRIDEPLPLDGVLARLDEHVDSNDHFELFVFPYTRTALTLTSRRTDREPRPPGRARVLIRDVLLENAALEVASRTGRRFPALIPRVNRTLVRAMSRAEHLDR
ncbi:MAG: FAD-binding protein, partial [Thermoleophilaceae bacterium]